MKNFFKKKSKWLALGFSKNPRFFHFFLIISRTIPSIDLKPKHKQQRQSHISKKKLKSPFKIYSKVFKHFESYTDPYIIFFSNSIKKIHKNWTANSIDLKFFSYSNDINLHPSKTKWTFNIQSYQFYEFFSIINTVQF